MSFCEKLDLWDYDLENRLFQDIFQFCTILFSMVKEMGNGSSVAGAEIRKINGFSTIIMRKYRNQDS